VTRPRSTGGWTYQRAGVPRGDVSRALAALLAQVRYRPPGGYRSAAARGHYAGFVRVGRELLALTTDTVGTKTLLAAETRRWEEVGEDIVGVNVNDLVSVGARPAALVDCILCPLPDPEAFAQIGRGLDRGLREAGCGLVGGETAVVPEVVRGIDLGGTALGAFPDGRKPILGTAVRSGDRIIGLPSHGPHANGFTLIRRLLRLRHVDLTRPRPRGRGAVGRELLRPTRIYVRSAEALADLPSTTGLAHISGGGVRNLVRLSKRSRFVLEGFPEPSGIYEWLANLGPIAPQELYQTFNMGIGFVVIVRPEALDRSLELLRSAGAPDARVIGSVERGHGVTLPSLGLSYPSYA
jgi:phosphoribosylformylglycinamidine cyclo-ligase